MAYIPNPVDGTNPLDSVDISTAAAEFRALKAYIQQELALIFPATTPSGTILPFAGNTAPIGYLIVPYYQSNISRTTYANLFAAIGTQWGAGDGSTTFGLPWIPPGYTLAQAFGYVPVGTNTAGSVIAHNHSAEGSYRNTAADLQGGYGISLWQGTQVTTSTTGGTANLAASTGVLYIIKT